MGVGLVRSLQPPDILWIHWRVYNSIANTSKRVLFLPTSDVYVRSFLYLLYILIKLYYTKALSDQASSLAPDWILLLWRPRIPASFCVSATTFHQDWSPLGWTGCISLQSKGLSRVFSNINLSIHGLHLPDAGSTNSTEEDIIISGRQSHSKLKPLT